MTACKLRRTRFENPSDLPVRRGFGTQNAFRQSFRQTLLLGVFDETAGLCGPALDPRAKAAAPQVRAGRSVARDRRALARESEITPSSPKLRRELFEIVLQEEILFAAR